MPGRQYGPERIAAVMITEKWYRETTPRLKARIEDKTLFLPQDAHILADYRAFKVVRGVARIPDKKGRDATGKRHGDAGISGCMLIHARETFGSYEPWECASVDVSGASGTGIDKEGNMDKTLGVPVSDEAAGEMIRLALAKPGLPSGVYDYTVITQQKIHLTSKPVSLLADLLAVAVPGGTILDPFIGGGTTALAAMQTGRKRIGIELSEAYADIAAQRLSGAM